jgi:protein TonB
MDFARQQRDPKRHLIGIGVVLALHAVVVYALMTGLATKTVEVLRKPVTVAILEEIRKPPPPPPPPPPRPPPTPPVRKVQPPAKPAPPPAAPVPAPAFVPPPDISPPVQSSPASAITAMTPTPPAEPLVIAPPAPPAPPVVVDAPPPPPPKPAVRRGVQPLFREDPVYPRAAMRAGIDGGRVVARLSIDAQGRVDSVAIVSAEPPRHFESAVRDALMRWRFEPEGERYVAEVEVVFALKDN